MKYTAHLATGGTLELELDSEPDLFETTWLVDANGVMVNMTHVAALVPESTGEIAYLIDREMEIDTQLAVYAYAEWVCNETPMAGMSGQPREAVASDHGPPEEVRE